MGKESKYKPGEAVSRQPAASAKRGRPASTGKAGNDAMQRLAQANAAAGRNSNSVVQQAGVSSAQKEVIGGAADIGKMDTYGPPSHAKGYLGEVNAAHLLGRKYGMENVIIAPKDMVNQGGIDIIVYDSANDVVLFIDNKATKSSYIKDATALTDNLAANTAAARKHIDSLQHIDPALKEKVLSAIDLKRIALRITTEYGNGAVLGQKLVKAGATIESLEFDPLPAGPKPVMGPPPALEEAEPQSAAPRSASLVDDEGDDSGGPRPRRRTPVAQPNPFSPSQPDELMENTKKRMPHTSAESALYDGAFGNTSTVVKGAMLDTALGVAQNLFNDWYKGYMKKELANMPMPKLDRRLASRYWTDPATAQSFNVIHMFNKDLFGFGRSLQERHLSLISDGYMDALKSVATRTDAEDRLFDIESIEARLADHAAKLRTVRDNLDAALEMESQAMNSAEAAEELHAYIFATQGQLVSYQWYSPSEVLDMMGNLRIYAKLIREGYRNVRELRAILDPMIEESYHVSHEVNRLYWREFFTHVKKKGSADNPGKRE